MRESEEMRRDDHHTLSLLLRDAQAGSNVWALHECSTWYSIDKWNHGGCFFIIVVIFSRERGK